MEPLSVKDIVTVTCGSYIGDMPVFNGYYADRGSCMLKGNGRNLSSHQWHG